jgi:Protein ENHANCED DISEASE RESISTANCE 2, C-terminal
LIDFYVARNSLTFFSISYRIHGGLAVETDYIITVQHVASATSTPTFETFAISKTYSAFRTLVQQLKQLDHPSEETKKYCHQIYQMIDTQRTAYLGKVNYLYVQVLAKQRKEILDHVLVILLKHCYPTNQGPDVLANQQQSNNQNIGTIISTFFLTDHVVCKDPPRTVEPPAKTSEDLLSSPPPAQPPNPIAWIGGAIQNVSQNVSQAASNTVATITGNNSSNPAPSADVADAPGPVVVPMTQRRRRSIIERDQEEVTLNAVAGTEAKLWIDDDRSVPHLPNYSHPVPTVRMSTGVGKWVDTNPWTFLAIAVGIVLFLQRAAGIVVSMDGDLFLLCVFASFCIGLHTPRPMVSGYDQSATMKGVVLPKVDRSGRRLLRQSMHASPRRVVLPNPPTDDELSHVEEVNAMGSPMAMFPDGAELGSHLNCWSRPDTSVFQVRGPNYFADKKKIPSADYIFPCRGVDLFLTDACPQNVGRIPGIMGGKLREIPTFIINFRLPWGVLLFYCEIPSKFIPFIVSSQFSGNDIPPDLRSTLEDMTPPERTVARWLMNETVNKNKSLKIVPVVVDGPWVVKSVVGGKPAIIGAKLPISYVYQPQQGTNALYIEADLDIAASSAARGILSVTRSYTQILTINLGFVIQANESDELPEQMLTGARLHGIDPLTAPSLPHYDDEVNSVINLTAEPVLTDEESI